MPPRNAGLHSVARFDHNVRVTLHLKIWAPVLILVAVALLFALAVIWMQQNDVTVDPYAYTSTYELARAILRDGPSQIITFLKSRLYYPPGYFILGGISHALLGYSKLNLTGVNFLFLALGALSIFGIGRRQGSDRTGLLAALLFLLFPVVAMFARIPSREICVAAMVAMSVFALVASRHLNSRSMAVLFAVAFSAGMMIKWVCVGFVFFPALHTLIESAVIGRRSSAPGKLLGLNKTQWTNMLIAVVLIFALLAPWYLGVADRTDIVRSVENDPTDTSHLLQRLGFYLKSLNQFPVSPAVGGVLLALVGIGLLGEHRKRQAILYTWVVSGYLVFSLMPHLEIRYILPLLPAVALLAAGGVQTLRPAWLKTAAWVLIFGVGVWQLLSMTFWNKVFPEPAGQLLTWEEGACKYVNDSLLDSVGEQLSRSPERFPPNQTIRMAVHPCNTSLSEDLIEFWALKRQINRTQPPVEFIGFARDVLLHLYVRDFDRIDLLLADQSLFDPSSGQVDRSVQLWRLFYISEKEEVRALIPPEDPALLGRIESEFSLIGQVQSPCVKPIRLLSRNVR